MADVPVAGRGDMRGRCRLRRLLSLSSSLAARPPPEGGGGGGGGGLSLRQLVPVHEALMDASVCPDCEGGGGPRRVSAPPEGGDEADAAAPGAGGGAESIVRSVLGGGEEAPACLSALNGDGGGTAGGGTATAPAAGGKAGALLAAQYLIRRSRERRRRGGGRVGAILSGLSGAALPLLFADPAGPGEGVTEGDAPGDEPGDEGGGDDGGEGDCCPQPPLLDPEVRGAIVEAAFLYPARALPGDGGGDGDGDDDGNPSLGVEEAMGRCAALCADSARARLPLGGKAKKPARGALSPRTALEAASRVLVRLLDLCDGGSAQGTEVTGREVVLDAMHRLVLGAMEAACYGSGDVGLVRPATALFLPRLYDGPAPAPPADGGEGEGEGEGERGSAAGWRRRAEELWVRLSELMRPPAAEPDEEEHEGAVSKKRRRCRNWEDVAPTVAAGVLCIVVPSLSCHPFPLSERDPTRVELSRHPLLWSFLRSTLGRLGSPLPGNDGGSGAAMMRGGGSFARSGGGATGGGDGDDGALLGGADGTAVQMAAVDQILRRRGVHILRLLVDAEGRRARASLPRSSGDGSASATANSALASVATWKKYVLCFEALEMEVEAHLVDQIWPTVRELCAAAAATLSPVPTSSPSSLPRMTWTWVGSLLSRVLLSQTPTLRKLGLYRFLNGDVGIRMPASTARSGPGKDDQAGPAAVAKESQKKKGKAKGAAAGKAPPTEPAPLSIVDSAFVLDVMLPSYDSLGSVGTSIHLNDRGKLTDGNVTPRLSDFITNYVLALSGEPDRLGKFVKGLMSDACINGLKSKTLALVYVAAAAALLGDGPAEGVIGGNGEEARPPKLPVSNATIDAAVRALRHLFAPGSVVRKVRGLILGNFAVMLSRSRPPSDSKDDRPDPLLVLRALALYPSPLLAPEGTAGTDDHRDGGDGARAKGDAATRDALREWLENIGRPAGPPNAWACDAGSACASAFVAGHLLGDAGSEHGSVAGATDRVEMEAAASIAKLCALAGGGGGGSGGAAGDPPGKSASEMLWPAVNRGLSSAASLRVTGTDFLPPGSTCSALSPGSVRKISRALLLLEHGCKERILSGMGHGDLAIDPKMGLMIPPPPDVERLLTIAVTFLLDRIRELAVCHQEGKPEKRGDEDDRLSAVGGATRSKVSGAVSSSFAHLIEQVRTLWQAYPSSLAVSQLVNALMNASLNELSDLGETDSARHFSEGEEISYDDVVAGAQMNKVKWMALLYAALTCGAEYASNERRRNLVETCTALLDMQFDIPEKYGSYTGVSKHFFKASRSVFQFAKWGSLSCLLPMIQDASSGDDNPPEFSSVAALYNKVFAVARHSVHSTPEDVLLPLFDTATCAAKHALLSESGPIPPAVYEEKMGEIISALLAVVTDTSHSPSRMHMVDSVCSLLFQPRLLLQEFDHIYLHRGNYDDALNVCSAPIKNAFNELMKMAGTKKPHIAKYVVSRITIAWLGVGADVGQSAHDKTGLAAIPYRDDIVNLLVYKESRMDDAMSHQKIIVRDSEDSSGIAKLPPGTSDLSIVRGFVLLFLSRLPGPSDLDTQVLRDLCHYVILHLLETICIIKTEGGMSLMRGSDEYCRKLRAWQAVCVLSRFVTVEIADTVCSRIFEAMALNMHGQIRYFIEVLTIQCAQSHPSVFGSAFVNEVRRRDLSLQHISSLMIIGGNLIVGRYSTNFMRPDKGGSCVPLSQVLAGVIPWLSSTQGFSRAIAQLLVHKLIPLVVDASVGNGGIADISASTNDWFLRSMWTFLEENPEMKRLRKKQTKFFDKYDADSACTAEGVLAIHVDDVEEANPLHMVEAMKQCLKEVFQEAHQNDAPMWKQVKELLSGMELPHTPGDFIECDESRLVNFQRKILPLDSLNLAMEESRAETLRNAAGRRRQNLIVCASLIDKVPNLAGLARTAEIFAAKSLVIPDHSVCKMDNFKSISVGAEEWIKIEECKEDDLLKWLNKRKGEGYSIIGLEQTSSSCNLSMHKFSERTVLLLGKEKEGIPVEFLQLVDTCVEIPQLGIIRSLNVHVSGALTIWEYSKQMMSHSNRSTLP